MKPQFEVFVIIEKPIGSVFDAVYNPKKLTQYFTTRQASAPLKGGATVHWDFADFPGAFPVKVRRSIKNKRIEIAWKAQDGDYDTRVRFTFRRIGPRRTKLTIAESGWRSNPKALKAAFGNCFGWTQMSAALKVWLEHGFNLRDGYFK